VNFRCQVTQDGLSLSIGAHQGPYPAWWKQIRAEVYGWTPQQKKVLISGHVSSLAMEQLPQGVFVNVNDDGKGLELELQ
jgi:alpha-glucosidase